MEKAEIKRIGDFLNDVQGGIFEGDGYATMQIYLGELYRIIPILMNATLKTKDQKLKPLLATLEMHAREYKDEIEKRLAIRN